MVPLYTYCLTTEEYRTVATNVANAYSISAIKEFDKNDSDGFLGKSYSVINMAYLSVCSGLMLFNMLISMILFSNEFFVAWKYVPILLVSAFISQIPLTCDQYYIAVKKTKIISFTAIVGALLNCILNLLLIPKYSIYGAVIATISFFIVCFIKFLLLSKYIHLKHSVIREIFCMVS